MNINLANANDVLAWSQAEKDRNERLNKERQQNMMNLLRSLGLIVPLSRMHNQNKMFERADTEEAVTKDLVYGDDEDRLKLMKLGLNPDLYRG